MRRFRDKGYLGKKYKDTEYLGGTLMGYGIFKSESMRKPRKTRHAVIERKSPISLKLGINVVLAELSIVRKH